MPKAPYLDVIDTVVGQEKCFGAVKGKVKAGAMTYFRLSTDDRAGKIKTYIGEGAFTDDPFGMDGGIAVTEVPRLRQLLGFIAQNGFEHHVAMVRGHYASTQKLAGKRARLGPEGAAEIVRIRAGKLGAGAFLFFFVDRRGRQTFGRKRLLPARL